MKFSFCLLLGVVMFACACRNSHSKVERTALIRGGSASSASPMSVTTLDSGSAVGKEFGERVFDKGVAHATYEAGYLYWSAADGIYRSREGTRQFERIIRSNHTGSMSIRDGQLHWSYFSSDNSAVLSVLDVATGRSHQLTSLACWSWAMGMVVYRGALVVGGSCEPELVWVDALRGKRIFAHPGEGKPFLAGAGLRDSIAGLCSSEGWIAWLSQMQVYIGDPDGHIQRVWDPRNATAIALTRKNLYWASGKTALDVDNGPTTIGAMSLSGGAFSSVVSGLGHVYSMQAQEPVLYYTVEPDQLQAVNVATKTVRTIGKTPPGLNVVVLGERHVYMLSPDHGIYAYPN